MDRAGSSVTSTPGAAVPPGAPIGVVMLDTRFPRPPGDIGHPATFGGRSIFEVVRGAWPAEVVTSAQRLKSSSLLPAFLWAIESLQARGACAITTSCGFLVLLQAELQAAAQVPVASSSLLHLPALLAREGQVGVLTISSERLSRDYLLAAGVPPARLGDVVVQGVDPASEFATAILGNRESMDLARASADVVDAARALAARAPGLRDVVLECTNMPPYADAVRSATGWRLHDLKSYLASPIT